MRKGEPVKNTCPDIDKIIRTISAIMIEMNKCSEEDNVESLIESIGNWRIDLDYIAGGNHSLLEDLRSANSALRVWGQDLYKECDTLELKIEELENEISKQ